VMQSRLLVIHGHVQRDVEIIHIVADRLEDRTDALYRLAPEGLVSPLAHADEVARPPGNPAAYPDSPVNQTHPRNVRVIPKSRDFH